MDSINPFSSPDFKKQILNKQGLNKDNNISPTDLEDEDIEFVDFEEEKDNNSTTSSLTSVIGRAPKIPTAVKNVILDASSISKASKEAKAEELSTAVAEVLTTYNKEYGLDIQVDINSLSRTLVNVSDPAKRRALELYLSEMFQSIRPILILHMISKLALAVDYILDPARLLGGELTIQDTFVAVEKILQFIQQLEDMKDEIVIKSSDLELKKLKDENADGLSGADPHTRQVADDFLNLFVTEARNKKESEL